MVARMGAPLLANDGKVPAFAGTAVSIHRDRLSHLQISRTQLHNTIHRPRLARPRPPEAIQIADENVINNGTVTESLDENSSWALDMRTCIHTRTCRCTYMTLWV